MPQELLDEERVAAAFLAQRVGQVRRCRTQPGLDQRPDLVRDQATERDPLDMPIPARTGFVQLPPELDDPDPVKAAEKQNAFAKRNKELATPAKA